MAGLENQSTFLYIKYCRLEVGQDRKTIRRFCIFSTADWKSGRITKPLNIFCILCTEGRKCGRIRESLYIFCIFSTAGWKWVELENYSTFLYIKYCRLEGRIRKLQSVSGAGLENYSTFFVYKVLQAGSGAG